MTEIYIFNLAKFRRLIDTREEFTKKDLIDIIISSFQNIHDDNMITYDLISSLIYYIDVYPSLKNYFDYTASTLMYNLLFNDNNHNDDNILILKNHIEYLWIKICSVSDNILP